MKGVEKSTFIHPLPVQTLESTVMDRCNTPLLQV